MTRGGETRWLFGDQLGPHFLDADDQPVLLVESKKVFARRTFHRQKAHLLLSAIRHRAAELGDQCTYVRSNSYAKAVREAQQHNAVSVCHPTSRGALTFVQSLDGVEILPARGFVTSMADFRTWADKRHGRQLLMEDFYRRNRRRLSILMEGDDPVGGKWNYDADNRKPPPHAGRLDVSEPWWPTEDEIDDEVRRDLDAWERAGDVRFLGRDGPRRFAATSEEMRAALRHFLDHRLGQFGDFEDAMLTGDPWMAHSLLSAPLNLGLLDPVEIVEQAERAYASGQAPLAATEGFIRQIIGWRDYMWNVYWYQPDEYRHRNALDARRELPDWFAQLDADAVEARCLHTVLADLRDHGWVHHIPRLMVLGNYAMERGWDPAQLTDWFHRAFVDGYDWVMVANVVGMSQYADGGGIVTKPYAGGGAYINRMSDFCGGCRYDPGKRLGEDACPYTAGYWWFLQRNRDKLAGNFRLRQPYRGMDRLADIGALVEQEERRGSDAPEVKRGDRRSPRWQSVVEKWLACGLASHRSATVNA